MDKNTKYQQSSGKGTPSDAKKNQDVTNKSLPRALRRRESASTSSFSKFEQSKKYNGQKTKTFDKRPRPKGQHHGCSKEDTKVVHEESAELGSVMVPGSKKQNYNYLLNFHYEPRGLQGGSGAWNHTKSVKGNRLLPHMQRYKYNKEQFLQASCQFVVTSNGNYALHLRDPDVLVNWKLVEQIKLYSSENVSRKCPICLDTPVAGKMTRCGHIYCWHCILHCLSISDKSWCKCPICYESVQKSDLKSVIEITQSTLNSGDTVTLRLMRRERESLFAVPVGSVNQSPIDFFPVSDAISSQVYSKLLIANAEDIMCIVERERVQLKSKLEENLDSQKNLGSQKNLDSEEDCYVKEALNELLQREAELFKTMSESGGASTNATMPDGNNDVEKSQSGEVQASEETSVNATSANEEMLKPVDPQSTSEIQKFFYFYQAEDGQHLYLHPVNVKMLKDQYGSLENSPHVITGKLLEKEEGNITDGVRDRYKYLRHLPLTCPYALAEIELKPPTVSQEVLNSLKDQLMSRQKRRQLRERQEKKREKKITEEMNRRMGKYPTPIVHIDSQHHFPQWQPELLYSEESISSPPESATASVASSPSLSAFDEIVESRQTENAAHEPGPSFAEMLRNTGTRKKTRTSWPSIDSTRGKASDASTTRLSRRDDEEEEYLSAPQNRSFGDALAVALEQTKIETKKIKGGKKKKGKSNVLFATTMAHTSYN